MRLTLGTVQFGMHYGINNLFGVPDLDRSLSIINEAVSKGIKSIDTACAYGNAEDILGISSVVLCKDVKITSKLMPNCLDGIDAKNYKEILVNKLKDSLMKIGVKSLDGYLLHSSRYVFDNQIIKSLSHLKEIGLVQNIGVSIYEVDEALEAAKNPLIDYIQIPYSVFDQRLENTNFFDSAKRNNKKIFARSCFLQGLVFMKQEKIPGHLRGFIPYLDEYKKIIREYGVTVAKGCLLFSLGQKAIDSVVFGVDTIEQLRENIQNYICGDNEFVECRKKLLSGFNTIEKYIVMPSLWKK